MKLVCILFTLLKVSKIIVSIVELFKGNKQPTFTINIIRMDYFQIFISMKPLSMLLIHFLFINKSC